MVQPNRFSVLATVAVSYAASHLLGCANVDYDATGSQAHAVTFPASNADWAPVEQLGVGLSDPDTDAQNNGRNVVGNTTYPAVYIAANDTHFMVRMRLNDNPVSGQ